MRNPIYFTQEGLEKIKKEHDELTASRPDAVEHLKKAREMGDLSENGYYKASRAKLSFIDSRLRHLGSLIKHAQIIQTPQTNTISLGNQVTISDGKTERTYLLVGAFESNPSENKISDVSPIGKAIIGKQIGETIEVNSPSGKIQYKIINVK